MKTSKLSLLSVLAGLFCFTSSAVKAQGIEQWSHRFPDASKALGEWVRTHADAAHYIFEWDGHHPERSQAMVTWAIEHRGENLMLFKAQHRDWPELDEIINRHRPAAEEFLIWCRNHAEAARALVSNPKGLRWAGDHLYKDYLTMEKH
jgi:hypothetical protein